MINNQIIWIAVYVRVMFDRQPLAMVKSDEWSDTAVW